MKIVREIILGMGVCVLESSTLGQNHVSVIDRACSCMIVARLIKLTLTRPEMLPSHMAHHLTFHIYMLLVMRERQIGKVEK